MDRAVVGMGSCGIAAGAGEVFDACRRFIEESRLEIELRSTGCVGLCYREVLVELESPSTGKVLYGNVTAERVPELFSDHFQRQTPPDDLLLSNGTGDHRESEFLGPQVRVALRNCGIVDPTSIDDFRRVGGYAGLTKAMTEMSPEAVIAEISASKLRGRGGAGFPTGTKWQIARGSDAAAKHMICNADEGDPGAFMDRNIIEGDPFSVIEGMTIAAYAIGAKTGFIYVREEYPLAVERLERGVQQAREAGFLGTSILDSSFDFEIEIARGAGAFVCGEETALIAALEGRRGTPRRRPPFPVERGYLEQPTVVNNVETLANVPWVITEGADRFTTMGTPGNRGTKVFSLAGSLKRTGLAEVPMGITVREVLAIGGGSISGRPIKAVQIGGPSGGCLPEHLFDTPIDYDSLRDTGCIMGSGGFIALDETSCMVDIARYFLAFSRDESCGKCTFCRLGTVRMWEILDRLCEGLAGEGDLETLEELGQQVASGSMCGLGRAAPNPVLSSLKHFRAEYEAHLHQGKCPAGTCRSLTTFVIDAWVCDGCHVCFDQCVAEAIVIQSDVIQHLINTDMCLRCGGCREACRFDAVVIR